MNREWVKEVWATGSEYEYWKEWVWVADKCIWWMVREKVECWWWAWWSVRWWVWGYRWNVVLGYERMHETSCTLENGQQRDSERNGWGILGMKAYELFQLLTFVLTVDGPLHSRVWLRFKMSFPSIPPNKSTVKSLFHILHACTKSRSLNFHPGQTHYCWYSHHLLTTRKQGDVRAGICECPSSYPPCK